MADEKVPTIQDTFKTRETQSQAGINSAYDSSLNTQKQGLLNAYNQNTQAQAQQQQDVQNAYKQASYDDGVPTDRNDGNQTQFADARDVNTGLGSQHQLRLGNARAGADAKVGFAQQQALAESQRQAALLETNYKNQVASALADNDYKRAAALMDDYNNQNKWREQQAQQLASFGNFDPYRQIYGDETANQMQTMWNRQNPDEAYGLGRIDAETYRQITGRYPAGYNPGGGGGGYGGWYGGPTGDDDKQTRSLFGVNNASAGRPLMPLNNNIYHTAYSKQTPSLYGLGKASSKG